jgi:hypothetical protein
MAKVDYKVNELGRDLDFHGDGTGRDVDVA